MSTELLLSFCGKSKDGLLKKWIADFNGTPRICWYGSSGHDFRETLFLSSNYRKFHLATKTEPMPPDIYIKTDYMPWRATELLYTQPGTIHKDKRTQIDIVKVEELPKLILPLEFVHFPNGGINTGRVVFMEIEIRSKKLGHFKAPVIYAFVENTAFIVKRVLKHNGIITHIVNVRSGGGCGGGGISHGLWQLNILERLKSEMFVSDISRERFQGVNYTLDDRIYQRYPILEGDENRGKIDPIKVVRAESWSGQGNVYFNLIQEVEHESVLEEKGNKSKRQSQLLL